MNKIRKTAVLYHYPCPDGAFAALAANLYFSHCSTTAAALFFPNTVYSPLRIVVLDHHKTALEMLGSGASVSGNVINVIDMKRSGATIAYDYFKEKLLHGDINSGKDGNQEGLQEFDRVRRLFEYIEDSDLWRWRLPNSKAFSSGLKDLNLEFNARLNPSLFQQLLSLDLESLIRQGMESLSYKQRLIDEVLEQSYEIALGGGAYGRCLAVDADSISELRSELGNQLANKSHKRNLRGIGAVVYRVPELENDDLLKISLRSIDNEDTTPISQYLCRNTEVGGIEMLVHSC
ncbi:Hypothetical predicted protein [Olea europaea subsp. europaea]|uniref:Uncharacterized protein n=2 Tax=Olea europaea subsp. europaea TaxID=158383 RepID=A0A8S0PED9_OLEEU|nr:Hypothetical predicted protein [Olea europaea subsp. europaea]